MSDRSLKDIAESITLSVSVEADKNVGKITSIVDDISSTLYEQLSFLEMMSDSLDDLLQSRVGGTGDAASAESSNPLEALTKIAKDQLQNLAEISASLKETLAFQKEDALDRARREQLGGRGGGGGGGPEPEEDAAPARRSRQEPSSGNVFGDVLQGTLYGSILSSLTGSLAALGKSLLPGIKGLRGLLKTGGITLVIWGIYEIFKDIGENENFQNLLVKIQEIWNNRIIPAFQSIVQSLTDIGEIVSSAFGGESVNDLRIFVQNVFIAAVEDLVSIFASLVKSISGVVQWVSGLVDIFAGVITGDWTKVKEGFSKAVAGALKFYDGIIESLLTLIGFDVEVDSLSAIKNAWAATVSFISDEIEAAISGLKDIGDFIKSIPERISNGIDFLAEKLSEFTDYLVTIPTRLKLSAQELWANTQAAFMRKIAELVDWFTSLPERIMLAVNRFVLEKGGIAASIFGVDEESIAEQEAALEARRGMSQEALDQIEQTRLEALAAIEEQRRRLDQANEAVDRTGTGAAPQVLAPNNSTTDARRYSTTTNNFVTAPNPLAGVDRAMPQ